MNTSIENFRTLTSSIYTRLNLKLDWDAGKSHPHLELKWGVDEPHPVELPLPLRKRIKEELSSLTLTFPANRLNGYN